MYECFAGGVRRAVRKARDEARALDAPAVGAEHFLLSLADGCGLPRGGGMTKQRVRGVLERHVVSELVGLLSAASP